MKVIKFKECNAVYAKDQPEYLPLPSHKTKDGEVTSCWKLSFWERLKVLITGRIFLQILTFNESLQPLKMIAYNPLRLKKKKEKLNDGSISVNYRSSF